MIKSESLSVLQTLMRLFKFDFNSLIGLFEADLSSPEFDLIKPKQVNVSILTKLHINIALLLIGASIQKQSLILTMIYWSSCLCQLIVKHVSSIPADEEVAYDQETY